MQYLKYFKSSCDEQHDEPKPKPNSHETATSKHVVQSVATTKPISANLTTQINTTAVRAEPPSNVLEQAVNVPEHRDKKARVDEDAFHLDNECDVEFDGGGGDDGMQANVENVNTRFQTLAQSLATVPNDDKNSLDRRLADIFKLIDGPTDGDGGGGGQRLDTLCTCLENIPVETLTEYSLGSLFQVIWHFLSYSTSLNHHHRLLELALKFLAVDVNVNETCRAFAVAHIQDIGPVMSTIKYPTAGRNDDEIVATVHCLLKLLLTLLTDTHYVVGSASKRRELVYNVVHVDAKKTDVVLELLTYVSKHNDAQYRDIIAKIKDELSRGFPSALQKRCQVLVSQIAPCLSGDPRERRKSSTRNIQNDKLYEIKSSESAIEIVKIMVENEMNVEMLRDGLTSLSRLACDISTRKSVYDAGAVDVIMKTMKKHIKNADIQRNATEALYHLMLDDDSPQFAKEITRSGGVRNVLDAIKNHETDGGVVLTGLEALYYLAKIKPTDVRKGKALTYIHKAMVRFPNDVKILLNACATLQYIVHDSDITMLTSLVPRIHDAMIRFVDAQESHANLHRYALEALNAMVSICGKQLIANDGNGVRMILNSMKKYHYDVVITRHACLLLRQLCDGEYEKSVVDVIVQNHGKSAIEIVMASSDGDTEIVENGRQLLISIANLSHKYAMHNVKK